jgi:hypothetical protein
MTCWRMLLEPLRKYYNIQLSARSGELARRNTRRNSRGQDVSPRHQHVCKD